MNDVNKRVKIYKMSASNGGIVSEEDKNFFNTIQTRFPEVVDGKINTCQFLESSRGVVSLVEKFGKVFAPVKYDMQGNIEKLTQRYDINKEKHKYLNDMVLIEKAEGGNFATDALLWLRRALQFIEMFLSCILEDYQEGKKTENLVPFLKKAYKETLQSYHGWLAKRLFEMISKMCPARKDLFLTLGLGREVREEAVMRDMALFLTSLKSNIDVILKLYLENDLESDAKV